MPGLDRVNVSRSSQGLMLQSRGRLIVLVIDLIKSEARQI